MNQYQKELQQLLRLSTLTPASYVPSNEVKTGTHAAVFVGGKPFMLLGPSDDMESMSLKQKPLLHQKALWRV